jgi:hypothetical protein
MLNFLVCVKDHRSTFTLIMSIEMSDTCGLKNNEISLQKLHYEPWLLHSKETSLKITDREDQTKV